MKNYYEILEVDPKASPEVIEKAYKALVKKYHPDLQNGIRKNEFEEKMKEINEAYSVLSDEDEKNKYDERIKEKIISREEYEKAIHENERLRDELERNIITPNRTQNNHYQDYKPQNEYNGFRDDNTISNMGKIMKEQIKRVTEQAYNKAYEDAYVEDMRNRGYKIKYKHDLKYYIKLIGCTLIVILALVLIYQIPLVKSFFTDLYEENIFFRIIINVFKSIIDVLLSTFSTKIW